MKQFYCACGAQIFFENNTCIGCGQRVGFDPAQLLVLPESEFSARMRPCGNSLPHQVECNWLVQEHDSHSQCISCRTTRVVPDQNLDVNRRRWRDLESAKRRMMYNLLNNGLFFTNRLDDPVRGLAFDFLEDQRTNPSVSAEHVNTGHQSGLITINAAEADPEFRVNMREEMNERYRTSLGHFRHEIGHYYMMHLIEGTDLEDEYLEIFGDYRQDYQEAMNRYYALGPIDRWQEYYISPYAAMHPMEDWAETWAHYLHMSDTMETARTFGLISGSFHADDIEETVANWIQLTMIMNALNRSVGKGDAYPFVITASVTRKLRFVRDTIQRAERVNRSFSTTSAFSEQP